MKFFGKLFFSTLIIIALIFGVGSSVLIDSVFRASMEREERITLDENQMLRFSFVTAANSAMATAESYGLTEGLSESAIRRIAWSLENSNGCSIRISDVDGSTIYASSGFRSSRDLREQVAEDMRAWVYFHDTSDHYLQAACTITVGDRPYYLENLRDVGNVLRERSRYLQLYRLLAVGLMALSAVLMFLLSFYLTRPMERLSAASRRIAGGEYQLRCPVSSRDEIGALTEDFNAMADSLEAKIHQLEDAAQRQEDFIASFAHELKTPLTSIIGYSDMLRGQVLPPEQQFKAANYICTEGQRLEALAHKLLELIVYRRQKLRPVEIAAQPWLAGVAALLQPAFAEHGITLQLRAEEGSIWGEEDLLKSLVLNLCDNARKASAEGALVELIGQAEAEGYRITVRDHGYGIPIEELLRVTEPFYMVDKSRARAQNGAGLGLSLCKAVAELHGSALEFQSAPGEGTAVSVLLKKGVQEDA